MRYRTVIKAKRRDFHKALLQEYTFAWICMDTGFPWWRGPCDNSAMSSLNTSTPGPAPLSRRFSIAPMMAYTTRDFRYLARLITRRTLLYTEMVVAPAVIHGDRDRLLGFDAAEHPLAVQLGGSDPEQLAEAARICSDYGYDEINLNVGCPSDRVQQGKIGAVLMAEPELVARCVEAMANVTDVPVTVKTRIGIDDQDDYPFLQRFVRHMDEAGCRSLTIHARKAILTASRRRKTGIFRR